MRIGLDVFGGDFAPHATLEGVKLLVPELQEDECIVLFGDEQVMRQSIEQSWITSGKVELVHAPEIITMEDSPMKAYQQKQNSSIVTGFNYLRAGKINGFASAGNSGAMMVGAVYTINTISGIIRPASIVLVPKVSGGHSVLLDVGTNPDAKPDVLCQYGMLGAFYAQNVLGVENPTVGLLSIGEEEKKGNLLVQSTFPLMKESTDYNFIGNVEGRDLFGDKADVIVTDGFTGNIVLKQIEAMYRLMQKRGLLDSYFERFSYEVHGGSPLVGINKPVVIGHGISSPLAIKNMMRLLRSYVSSNLNEKIKFAMNNYGH